MVGLFLELVNPNLNLLQQLLSVFELSFIVLYFFLFHVSLADLFLKVFVVLFATLKTQLQGLYLLPLVFDPLLEVSDFNCFLVDFFYV